LREFVRVAKRAIELHVESVRLETFNSSLLELSHSVNQMVEQEYANVSAGATGLMNAFSRSGNSRRISNINPTKTRMSSVRGICEGLRQGLSLVSRTNTLLASEFGDYAPLPPRTHRHTLVVVSVLIAASHIVNSGLLLLSQSDLTRYTHAELWEITRGIEELSMLIEHVQEQLDEKKQFQLRCLLLDECPLGSNNAPLEQRLSELSLLTDPIDSLRPASVGHIIYLLARYRSSTPARILVGDLL
uniref:Exocyst complex component Sec8 n=1 Tax=Hydatigena taeniaeformis TaxID=6205 RepID=A0A0R3WVA0_HYDTA